MITMTGSLEPSLLAVVLLVPVLVALLLYWRSYKSRQVQEPHDASAFFADAFIIKPYLQLGNHPLLADVETVQLFWHTRTSPHAWQVQVRMPGQRRWSSPLAASAENVDIAHLGIHTRCSATISGLPHGTTFEYRLLADGAIAFSGSGKSRQSADQPFTFAVAGDLGEPQQRSEQKIAYQISLAQPDFVAMPGDLVYNRGRVSEYMAHFFPVYNADLAADDKGAPLLRSRIVMPAPGNHDVGLPNPTDPQDLSARPDLFGYFQFWSVPLNGPYGTAGNNTPTPVGDAEAIARFATAAGDRFPRIANYSFDWGNAHWLVLDSNAYVDWTDAGLRAWVEADLAAAQDATWRFVMFHHPTFSSDGKHVNEQRMRLLTPLFERWNVDVVFTGHNHCYERTVPLRFQPKELVTKLHTEECAVPGSFILDRAYDGHENNRPNGIIYIVDGAAGAKFYVDFKPPHDGLKPYTAVYDQRAHSFTLVTVEGRRLIARQITEDGEEIDRYIIQK
jgi:3',5'-cyclic AMP phosphodiesterase CpdA